MEAVKTFSDIGKRLIAERKDVLNLGVVWPSSKKYIEAITEAADMGLIKPILIGNESEIMALLKKSADYSVINANSPAEAAQIAFQQTAEGQLDVLLKADIAIREFVEYMYTDDGIMSKGDFASHICVARTPKYHKLMFITDPSVNAAPDTNTKIKILTNAASLVRKFGHAKPKAAMLAAVEAIYPAIPVTMEEAAVAKMSERGQIKDMVIDGPLSFDVAISKMVAHSKGITNSEVAGETDIFMLPTMEVANGLYKAMVQYVKADAGGIIYGAKVPIAVGSAVDSSKNILNSILLAVFAVKS